MIAVAAHISLLGFAGLMLAAAVSDLRKLLIPNWISLALALLFPIYVLTAPSPVDWIGATAVAFTALVLGFALFNFRILGGGDAKLFAAAALWAGPELVIPFAFATAISGGALAVLLWLAQNLPLLGIPVALPSFSTTADFAKQPLPYGVAIALGATYLALKLFGVD